VSPKSEAWLWIGQRASAVVLAVCVVVHLATVIYAVQGGLSAAEILGRTRGNVGWLVFYCIFVLAVAVHAPIGLRSVLGEWLGWRGRAREGFLVLLAGLIALMGWRAALAVFGAASA
jgi:fumarate reductase subunit C